MIGNLEQNRGAEIQQSVGKKSDNFLDGEKYGNIQKEVKQKVELLEILDELEFPEEKQEEILRKILKYNLVNELKDALDKDEIIKLIEKKEVETEKKEVKVKVLNKKNEYEKLSSLLNEKKGFKQEQTEQVKEQTEQVKEQTEQVKEQTEQVKKETNSLEKFIKNKNKIDGVLKSINALSEDNIIYGNIISKVKNFDVEKYKNESPEKVLEEFQKIIDEFKQNPVKLQAVVKDLGGVNSKEYKEFKNSILYVDSSFGQYFKDIEAIDSGDNSLATTEIENGIEKESGGIMDLKLGENPPSYDMRMIGSNYAFENEIDKQKLANLTSDSKVELNEIYNNGFKVLKDFKNNFTKQNYDISKLDNLYNYFDIDSNLQIEASDLEDFRNVKTLDEKLKIFSEKIKPKIDAIVKIITEKQKEVLNAYKDDIKKIIESQQEKQEKQKKTLEFLHNIGFDLIPKDLTDKVIYQINNSSGLKGAIDLGGGNTFAEKIDLQNGELGFTSGTNHQELFTRFFNKMISGSPTEPINVNDILNGTGVGVKDRTKFLEYLNNGILKNPGAFSGKALENLKKPVKSQSQEQKEK